jgi:mRNA-degrading endonuclease RelE of RelBE toxin-antitoxin system
VHRSVRRRLVVSDDIASKIRRLPPELKRRVRATLDAVLRDPTIGKALRDPLVECRSARAGRLRIVYRVSAGAVRVVTVGTRSTVYEEAARLGRREREY